MIAVLALGAAVAVVAATWNRRGGGLAPLGLALLVLSPVAAVAWPLAQITRRRLARPDRVRRALVDLGLGALLEGCAVSAAVITKGNMNAVVEVTLTRAHGEPARRLVLKHMLRFGTLLAWGARTFGAMREYPALGRTARLAREVRALRRLRRRGIPAPRCLAYSVRRRLLALEWVDGSAPAAHLAEPAVAVGMGRLLATMHAAGVAMGDTTPSNLVLDRAGRMVPLDLELSHLGSDPSWIKRGFDLAWAAAFLPHDACRAAFFEGYGARPPALERAIEGARIHIARFSPLPEWEARRWSAGERTAPEAAR